MNQEMEQAAEKGDIGTFFRLIARDVHLLEQIDQLPYAQTPLHKAASAGHIEFAMEVMGLKPSFACKLNTDGLSPIHLALQGDKIQLVKRLLQFDGDLVRVKGRNHETPLHYLVKKNYAHDLLEEFILLCPDSIADVTVQNETALHIALKNEQLQAFKFLVEWIRRNQFKNASFYEKTILNWKDDEGNTVLHIAVEKKQTEAVSHLLRTWGSRYIRADLKNFVDCTPWDLTNDEVIKDMLRHAQPVTGMHAISSHLKHFPRDFGRELTTLSDERRNVLLVVAVLLVTITYQAVLSPPGGLWQDDSRSNTTEARNSHTAGTTIRSSTIAFYFFLVFNTLTFVVSNSMVIILLPRGCIWTLFFQLSFYIICCYFYSLMTIISTPQWTTNFVLLLPALVLGLPFLFSKLSAKHKSQLIRLQESTLCGLRIQSVEKL